MKHKNQFDTQKGETAAHRDTPRVEVLPDDHIDESAGGPAPEAASKDSPKTSAEVAQELHTAETTLLNLVRPLDKATADPILKTIANANKALHTFSHGSLTKQIEEQNKHLQEDILAQANLENENRKKVFANALQNYLSKRLTLANTRLQELGQKDEQLQYAQSYVVHLFNTPTGLARDGKVLTELGNKHRYIKRIEPGLLYNTQHVVTCDGGFISSESPRDLAAVVKAKGHTAFEFSKGSTRQGGHVLRQSIKEMLKIGIKDISLSNELRERMYTPRYAYSFSDALVESSRRLSHFQMEELRQLERICDASRSAHHDIQQNLVFDEKGHFNSNAQTPKPIDHQVNTFLRLTSDADRLAYLNILFPVNKAQHYVRFTTTLEKMEPKVTLEGLTPQEYFAQNMMWSWSRNAFHAEHNEQADLARFNDNQTSPAERELLYVKNSNPIVLNKMAHSTRLDNLTRLEMINHVFDDAQMGENKVGFYTHPILRTRTINTNDQQKFMDKMLALFKELSITKTDETNAKATVVDYEATATLKANALNRLRQKISEKFLADTKLGDNAFENFYINKHLVDQLAEKIALDHVNQQCNDHKINDQETGNKLIASFVSKVTHSFNRAMYPDEKANQFVNDCFPALQNRLWNQENANVPRAHVIMALIDHHDKAKSSLSLDFLKETLTPLLKTLSPTEAKELTEQLSLLCQQNGIHGCSPTQNEALAAVRDILTQKGPDFKTASEALRSVTLFKAYFNSSAGDSDAKSNPNPEAQAQRLIERIQCYASSHLGFFEQFKVNGKFDNEMRDLLYPSNRPNPISELIINQIQETNSPSENVFIQRLKQLTPRPALSAKNQEDEKNAVEMHDFGIGPGNTVQVF